MKSIRWLIATSLIAGSLLIWKSTQKESNESVVQPTREANKSGANITSRGTHPTAEPSAISPHTALPEDSTADEAMAAKQRILDQIHDAAVAYDPSSIPVIEPFLLHADPEVRAAAINGFIVLGERGAVPIMRAAAAQAPTPQDAMALLQAAEYIDLPSATNIIRKKKIPVQKQ